MYSLLGICLSEIKTQVPTKIYSWNIYSSFVFNHQIWTQTRCSLEEKERNCDTPSMEYYLTIKKKQTLNIYNTEESQIYIAKWKISDWKCYMLLFHLYAILEKAKQISFERRKQISELYKLKKGWGRIWQTKEKKIQHTHKKT